MAKRKQIEKKMKKKKKRNKIEKNEKFHYFRLMRIRYVHRNALTHMLLSNC